MCPVARLRTSRTVSAVVSLRSRSAGPPDRRRSAPTPARGGRGLDVEVLGLDLHLDRVRLWHHRNGGRRRMDAALRLGLGHALDAVHAALVLQLRVGAVTVDLELDRVEATFLAWPGVEHL